MAEISSYNNKPFSEIQKGKRGRTIAYTNISDPKDITRENIVQIIDSTSGIFEENKASIQYLWNYLHGDQPILYKKKDIRPEINSKIEVNRAEEIVKFKNGQTYGEPIQYVSRSKEEATVKKVDTLNNYLLDAGKHEKDITHGEWQSAVGTSFLAVQMKDDEIPFNIVVPTPLDTYIIYSKLTQEPMVAVQELEDDKGKYKVAYTKGMQYVIRDSVVELSQVHTFEDIPIIEYPNNAERISDIEIVIDLLDAINETASDRADGVKQFVQSLMVFKNCAIDDATYAKLRQAGALSIKSSRDMDSSVDMLTQELSQSDTQVVIDDMWDCVESILGMPSRQTEGSGDRVGSTFLKNGWDFSKQRANLKDPYVIEAEKRLCKVVLTLIGRTNRDCDITIRDFDVKVQHSPIDNLAVKTTSLQILIESGVDPLMAITTVGLFNDTEKVYLASKKSFDLKYYDKLTDTLTKMLSAGFTVEESAKMLGIKSNAIDASKWQTMTEEEIDVVE